MLGKLVSVETGALVTLDKFADEDALARENEVAQAETEGRLSWEQLSPFELGQMTANLFAVGHTLAASGGNES